MLSLQKLKVDQKIFSIWSMYLKFIGNFATFLNQTFMEINFCRFGQKYAKQNIQHSIYG